MGAVDLLNQSGILDFFATLSLGFTGNFPFIYMPYHITKILNETNLIYDKQCL